MCEEGSRECVNVSMYVCLYEVTTKDGCDGKMMIHKCEELSVWV